jgi:hypothetical protein
VIVSIVELRLAAGCGESLERADEFSERDQNRVLGKIRERQTNMIGVVERIVRQRIVLEIVDDLFVGHLKLH